MTGFDITLSTLKKIKKSAGCPVYFDYHILSMGRDSLGNRFLLKRTDWFEWCTSCDFLQLNEFEAKLLHGNNVRSKASALDFSEPILNEGVKSVAITLGRNGAIVCYNEKGGKTRCTRIAGLRTNKAVDATGCGDVFAAGFMSCYMISSNLLKSYKYANRVAALKTEVSGIKGLADLMLKMKI
jgi:sugar/nucleoside kinase (ribokinase family)